MKKLSLALMLLGACVTERDGEPLDTMDGSDAQSVAVPPLTLAPIQPRNLCTTLAGDCWTAGGHDPTEADLYCISECDRPARCVQYQSGMHCGSPPDVARPHNVCPIRGTCQLLLGEP